ncbi:Histidinol-phosphatase [Clostridium sp. N3C]|uniref:histidinol-phosphatase HisJ n=1 Tax=Clostridium sp. N3C TaxID=1776758 RepID=UPI00092DFC5D|nr:histidinol-phosphatase HisJ [Clostridium sp. N3C]SCN21510.1 Histidinol-phosphatase [Clostridium sp. N3C]
MNSVNILKDGHIHSPYCPHGTDDSFDLYVNRALEIGLKEISFMEHMPLPGNFMDSAFLSECSPTEEVIEEYFKELDFIKNKYKDKIKINIGLEVDYVEGYEKKITKLLDKYGSFLEDSILSVHFLKVEDEYLAVDFSSEEFGRMVEKLGGVDKVYSKYYETLLKSIKADLGTFKPKRIGHPTLVRKFNLDFPLEYRNIDLIEEIVNEIKARDYEIDYNTAGLRKNRCGETYPSGVFLDLAKQYDIRMVYGSDSHSASDVGKDFCSSIVS